MFTLKSSINLPEPIPSLLLDAFLATYQAALAEDLVSPVDDSSKGFNDITTVAVFSSKHDLSRLVNAVLVAREKTRVSGLDLALYSFKSLIKDARFQANVKDGQTVEAGDVLASLSCPLQQMLAHERSFLNLLQRLCGIATRTATTRDLLHDSITLLDTRKTTARCRLLEKYAVACGGGKNHRQGLYDAYMIKDNHIALAEKFGIPLEKAIDNVLCHRQASGSTAKLTVECDTLPQLKRILNMKKPLGREDAILLDNMDEQETRNALKLIASRHLVEVSGGVDETKIAMYNRLVAQGLKIDFLSMGSLTHSATACDIALDIQ